MKKFVMKNVKRQAAGSLSLLMAVCGVFTGCGESHTQENSVAEIVTTEATAKMTTEMSTEATTESVSPPIEDTDGKIFRNVKAGMSKEEIISLFGEPFSGIDTNYYTYHVNSNSDLESYINSDMTYFGEQTYKFMYEFDFSGDGLYSWKISSYFDSSICDYISNTLVPILQTDYPNLVDETDNDDDYYMLFYRHRFNKDNIAVLTYREFITDDIEFTDYRYYHENSGNYNQNDTYYSNNDANQDGYINGEEFQNAVGDYLDDQGY